MAGQSYQVQREALNELERLIMDTMNQANEVAQHYRRGVYALKDRLPEEVFKEMDASFLTEFAGNISKAVDAAGQANSYVNKEMRRFN
ncbi:MAG: hypothetical protein LBH25_13045 [Fibromonadaceae bacterium]|jgi:hypothetical protein|nr:hypothetical protein [Fibromonadaceae bacterium]